MSLTQALGISLAGLKVNQQQLAVLSHNIANANTEGYSRQVVEQSAMYVGQYLAGVKVEDIVRKSDAYLQRSLRDQAADQSMAQSISEYLDRAQVLFGQPGANNSLDTYTEKFFNDIKALADTPERSALKQNAVASGAALAEQVSGLADGIQNLRYQADQDIYHAVSAINTELRILYNVNVALNNAAALGTSTAGLLDERDMSLLKLSEYMDIRTYFRDNGQVTISSGNGIALLDFDLHQLSYTPAPSSTTFSSGGTLSAINVYPSDLNGNQTGEEQILVSGGVSGDGSIVSRIRSGQLQGLIQTRDSDLAGIVSQLNEFASNLRDAVNIIHNDGAGYPAAATLVGEREVLATEQTTWEGAVMIGVTQSNGTPMTAPNVGDTPPGFRPLTLYLDDLDTGSGAGFPTVQGIIDEINWHFGPPQNRVQVGALHDIHLAALDDSMAAGVGTYSFNLELDNIDTANVTMRVTGVAVTGGATVMVPAAFPSNDFTVGAGQKVRSGTDAGGGISVTLDMTTAAAGPYTVTLSVEVDDPITGLPVAATIDYVITEAASGLMNDRSFATATVGGTMGLPSSAQAYMRASLVKADGTAAGAGEPGFVMLETIATDVLGQPLMLALDELSSQESGNSNVSPAIDATERGFSHYFGLNNFFKDEIAYGETAEEHKATSAEDLAVRDDILDNPNLLSVGELTLSRTPAEATVGYYTYELSAGNNAVAKRIGALVAEQQYFLSAGGLPAVSLTLVGYAGEILGFNATEASRAADDASQQQLLLDGYRERSDAVSGVNLDEELANTVVFQNAYAASAKVITVVDELFQALLASFGR